MRKPWPPTSPERRKLPDQEAFSGLYLRRCEILSMQQSARIGTVPLFNPRFQIRSESFGHLESGILESGIQYVQVGASLTVSWIKKVSVALLRLPVPVNGPSAPA